eukprot:13223816-Alexandrium_andersonii.AAC.1
MDPVMCPPECWPLAASTYPEALGVAAAAAPRPRATPSSSMRRAGAPTTRRSAALVSGDLILMPR